MSCKSTESTRPCGHARHQCPMPPQAVHGACCAKTRLSWGARPWLQQSSDDRPSIFCSKRPPQHPRTFLGTGSDDGPSLCIRHPRYRARASDIVPWSRSPGAVLRWYVHDHHKLCTLGIRVHAPLSSASRARSSLVAFPRSELGACLVVHLFLKTQAEVLAEVRIRTARAQKLARVSMCFPSDCSGDRLSRPEFPQRHSALQIHTLRCGKRLCEMSKSSASQLPAALRRAHFHARF